MSKDKIPKRQNIERQNIEETKYRTHNIEKTKYRKQNIEIRISLSPRGALTLNRLARAHTLIDGRRDAGTFLGTRKTCNNEHFHLRVTTRLSAG